MDKKFNIIYGTLAVLVAVILVQSYMIYDFKNSMIPKIQEEELRPINTITLNDYKPQSIDPFERMKKVQEEIQKSFGLFNSIFADDPFFKDAFRGMGVSPLSDLHDDGKEYVIEIDIPGVEQKNINIKTENNQITISANTDTANEEENTNYMHKERFTQRFYRSFTLPSDADATKVESFYKNGVLKVVIPKKA